MRHLYRSATFLIAIGAVVGISLSAAAKSVATVQPNIQVNLDSSPTRTHEAPSLAVSPKDSNTIVLGEVDLQNRKCLTHISTDGGHTWADGASPQNSDYVNCGPQNGNFFNTGSSTFLAYDAEGTLYYAFAAAKADDGESRSILLGKSTDNGRSFSAAVVYKATGSTDPLKADVNFQPVLTIDPDTKLPHRIYVGFRRTFDFDLNKLDMGFAATSQDGGATFGDPVEVGVPARNLSLVVSKGNLLAFFAESTPFPPPGPAKVYMAKSTDHGKSFTTTVIEGGAKRISSPAAAVDSTNGAIVIAWYDNHLAKPSTVQDDVLAKHSTDGGNSWSSSVLVSPSHPSGQQNVNQLYPTISAAPNGRVDVVWYDYRNDPFPIPDKARASYLGQIADVYAASSTDDGSSFSDAVRVTDHPIDRRIGTWNGQYFYVIPPAVVSSNSGYFAAWSDTRNGNPDTQAQDIFTSRVDVPVAAAAATSAGPDLKVAIIGAELLLLGIGIGLLVAALRLRRRAPTGPQTPVQEPAHTRSR